MHLKKHFFTDEVQKIIVTKCSYPCLLLKKLKFSKHDRGKDFNINNLINKIKEQDYLCALGNSEYIEVISINRKLIDIYSMYLIRNPDFIRGDFDTSFFWNNLITLDLIFKA